MASFARELETNNLKAIFHISKSQYELHPHNRNGFKESQNLVLPPINSFGGWVRSKPRSGFSQATLISSQGQLDFSIQSAGFVEKLFLEMELTIANNPVTFLPHYSIQRVEYLSTEGNILETYYGDNIYVGEKIHQTLEIHNRIRSNENLDGSYNAISIPVGFKRIIIPLPSITDGADLKLNTVRGELLVRIYFSNLCVVAGSALDISVSSCDILQKTQQLSQYGEAAETRTKMTRDLYFRILAPVRYASETKALTPSGQFDIRLTSANNLCAFLYFVIRPAPITAANVNVFTDAVDFFELLDDTNVIQGLKTSPELNILQKSVFDGDILNYKKINILPFAIDIEAARQGNQVGFYAFSSNEIIRLYTKSTLVSGSYVIDVYGLEYHCLQLNKGNLSIKK